MSEQITAIPMQPKHTSPSLEGNPKNQYQPTSVTKPGAVLTEALQERQMTMEDLAKQSGLSTEEILYVIEGGAVSSAVAAGLEQALGIPARFWLAMSKNAFS